MYALIPTFALRIVAILLAVYSVVYLSYRAVWAPKQRWAQHLLAGILALLILVVGVSQLRNQWKAEHPSVVATVATPSPQAQPTPTATPPITVLPHPVKKNLPQPHTGGIHGSGNTVVGDGRPVTGDGNTIVGATDSNGNTILNRGGTAIGAGATADPTSIAIGAGAHAGGQQQTCETGSLCNQGTTVQAPQTVNNYGPPPLKLTWQAKADNPTPDARFVQKVRIESNVMWTPVSIAIVCDAEIKEVRMGTGAFTMILTSLAAEDKRIGLVRYTSPTLAPGSPVEVFVLSDTPFTVKDVVQAQITQQ
jgi:hypothetical protein